MKRIQANVAIEEGLAQHLQAVALHGNVHSVFDNVINWKGSDGELYCITTSKIDEAYNTINTDLPTLAALPAKQGMAVMLDSNCISIGETKLEFTRIKAARLILPEWVGPSTELAAIINDCCQYIERNGKRGGMLPPEVIANTAETKGVQDIFGKALQDGKRQAEEAIVAKDSNAFLQAAKQLLGLGNGLTPSGDDYLCGLILTFNLPASPLKDFRQAGHEVAKLADEYTTDISAWELRKAAKGQPRRCMAGLLEKILNNVSGYTDDLDRLLGIGSLSGTDIAVGILSGLGLCMDKNI